MTIAIAIVHPRVMDANPQTKPTDLGCESADKWLLPSTSTVAISYYYSARKLILIYRPTEGERLSRPRYCRKGAQSVLKAVHRSAGRDKHNCRGISVSNVRANQERSV